MNELTFYFNGEPIGTMEAEDLQAVVSTEPIKPKEALSEAGQNFVAAVKEFSAMMRYISPEIRRRLEQMKAYQEAVEAEAHRAVEDYKQRRGIVCPTLKEQDKKWKSLGNAKQKR